MEKKFEKIFSFYQHNGGYANPSSNKKLKISHVGNQFFENIAPEPTSPTRQSSPPPQQQHPQPPPNVVIPVVSIDNYALEQQNHEDAMYLKRLQETERFTEPMAKQLPKLTSVLNFMWKLPEKPLWLISSQQTIVNSKYLTYPNPPILTREYIKGFLRTPIPRTSEQACQNSMCESERLGGFRIRILGIENNNWCFLCHLYHTNCLFLESLNRKGDNERAIQINFFGVQVGADGEYRYEALLQSESDVKGLYAPFPVYNTMNFTQTTLPNGCKAWVESDSVVFRLSQTMSVNQIESSQAILAEQARSSVQSNPISSMKQSLRNP